MGNPLERYRQAVDGGELSDSVDNPVARFHQAMQQGVRPAVDTTHPVAPTPVEKFSFVNARASAEEKEKHYKEIAKGLLARGDLSPTRRARLQKWLADSGNFFENTTTEDRLWIENVGRGVMDGLAQAGYGLADLAAGVAQMPFRAVQAAIGDEDANFVPLRNFRNTLHEGMMEAKFAYDPQGVAGLAGQVVGTLGGGAPIYGPVNVAALRTVLPALGRVSPSLAKAVLVGLQPGARFGQRLFAEAVASGSVDVAQAADILMNDDLYPTWDIKARALGLTIAASGAGAVFGAARPRRAKGKPLSGTDTADKELVDVETALEQARQPTSEDVERLHAKAQERLVIRDKKIAGKAIHEWNKLTPEQRKTAYPDLAEFAESKYKDLPIQAKAKMRTAVTHIVDEQLGVADANARIAEIKAESAEVEAKLRKQLDDALAERRKFEELAMTSEKVPSLRNFRAFTGLMDRLRAAGTLEDHEFLFMDLRALKETNDYLGHAEGDARLNRVGLAMLHAAAEMKMEGRDLFHPSGDEFIAVVPKGRGEEFLNRVQAEYGEVDIVPGARKSKIDGVLAKTFDEADKKLSALKVNRKPEEQRIPVADTDLDTSPTTEETPTGPKVTGKENAPSSFETVKLSKPLSKASNRELLGVHGKLVERMKTEPLEEVQRDIDKIAGELGRRRAKLKGKPPKKLTRAQAIEEAVKALENGDNDAFERAIQQHGDDISEEILRRIGGQDLVDLFARKADGKLGAGLDKNAFHSLGANLYAGKLPVTVAKEGLQNAIDAIRGQAGGKVWVSVVSRPGTADGARVRFEDNGKGMTKEIMENQLIDIGGTDKPEGSSGGLGLAKVALFYYAKDILIQSVTDTPQGRISTTMRFSSDDWINGTIPDPVVESVPSGVSTGTKMELAFKDDADFDMYSFSSFITKASDFSPGFEILFKDSPYAREWRKPKYTKAPNVLLEASTKSADIKAVMTAEQRQYSDYDHMPVHVLNRGYYQTTMMMRFAGEGPTEIIVDISANVDPSDPLYPFTANRESLKGEVKDMIDEVAMNMTKLAAKNQAKRIIDSFVGAPRIPGTTHGRVIDTSLDIEPDMLEKIAATKYAKDMFTLFEDLFSRFGSVMEAKVDQITPGGRVAGSKATDFFFGGIGAGKGYLGINIRLTGLEDMAKEVGLDGSGIRTVGSTNVTQTNAILVNPYNIVAEIMGEGRLSKSITETTANQLSEHTIGTIVHEIAHQFSRGHGEEFAGVLTRALGATRNMGSDIDEMLAAFWKEHAIEIYAHLAELEKHWSPTNKFRSFSGHEYLSSPPRDALGGADGGSDIPGRPGDSQSSAEGGSRPPEAVREGGDTGKAKEAGSPELPGTIPGSRLAERLGGLNAEVIRDLKSKLKTASPSEKFAILNKIAKLTKAAGVEGEPPARPTTPVETPPPQPLEPASPGSPTLGAQPDAPPAPRAEGTPPRVKKPAAAEQPKTTRQLLDELDKAEDKLDKRLDKKEITDDEYGAQWSRIGEARAELRKRLAKEEAARRMGPPPTETVPTIRSRYPMLAKTIDELRVDQELAKSVQDPKVQAGALEEIRQAIRTKKPVTEFDHGSLLAHDREIRAMLQDASPEERAVLADRLADVRNEMAKRRGPNLSDFMGDESGGVEISSNSWWDTRDVLTGDEKEVMDHIVVAHGVEPGWQKSVKTLLEDPMASVQELFYNFRRSIERSILPLENLGLETGQWAQLFSGWSVRAEQWLFNRPFLWNEGGVKFLNVKPLAQIVGGFKERTNKLRTYMYARRALEVGETKSGLDQLTAQRVVSNADPDIVEAAAEASRFADASLLYAVDAGLIKGKLAETLIKLYRAYTPLHRILQGEEVVVHDGKMVGVRARPSSIAGPRKVIYRLTGNKAKIVDPIQALTENTRRIIREADLNRIGLSILKKVRENPESMRGIAELDDQASIVFGAKAKKVFDEMKKLAAAEGIAADDETLKDLTLMMSRERLGKRNDKLVVYENGKRVILRVAPDIAEAIGSLSPEASAWWVQMIGVPTRLMKAGIVLQPLFPPLAAMKDALEATIRTKYGFKPWDSMAGFGIAISGSSVGKMLGMTESQYLREFRAGGGAFAALSGIEARSDKAAYRYVLNKGKNSALLHPIDALRRYARPFEEAARLGEFRRARLAGRSVLEASIAARNIAIDFSQAGGSMQALNTMIPFLNPAIQSIATDMRALRQQPKRVAAIGSALALGTWMLMAANDGDQEIEDLRKTPYGSLFLWFRLPNGEVAKIPKPYFWGQVFMTGAEQAYDRVKHDDPDAAARWRDALQNAMWGVGLPAVGQWYVGAKYNRETFTGAPVVPQDLEDLLPMYQISPNTSPIGRKVGEMLEVSPIQVDFAIRSAFGGLGRDLLSAVSIVDRARRRAPEPVSADLPVVGRLFGRYPAGMVEPVYKFYRDAEEIEKVANTAAELAQSQPHKYAAFVKQHLNEIAVAEVYAGARESMAEIRSSIEAINSVKSMDPKDKREYNDMMLRAIITLARQNNEIVRRVQAAQQRQQQQQR